MEMEPSRFASYRRIVARGRHITLTIVVAFQKFQPLVKLSGNFSETPARSWKLGAPGPLR